MSASQIPSNLSAFSPHQYPHLDILTTLGFLSPQSVLSCANYLPVLLSLFPDCSLCPERQGPVIHITWVSSVFISEGKHQL